MSKFPDAIPAAPSPPAGISAGQMSLVLDVARMLAVTSDLDKLLHRIAEAVTALLNCERASIFLHDPARGQLWTTVALGSQEIRLPDTQGIVGHVFHTNQRLRVERPYDDPRFNRENDRRTGFVTRNLLAAPMVDIRQKPVGVIQAINKVPTGGAQSADFTDGDLAMLQLLADQAGVAIQRYSLQQAALESMSLRREMELARAVQEAMIPKEKPDVPGLEAAGWTRPASINGGDVFDLWRTPDGRLGVLVADASVHGIAPAMVACQVRTLVRSLADAEGPRANPMRLMALVNTRLHEDLPAGRFVTTFIGFLAADGTLNWCSGGHGPIVAHGEDGKRAAARLVPATLPPLGIVPDLPGDAPPPVKLSPGGALLIASDGITEAGNAAGEMFGEQKLADLFGANAGASPEDAIVSVRQAVSRWEGKDDPEDDQTVVVVTRR